MPRRYALSLASRFESWTHNVTSREMNPAHSVVFTKEVDARIIEGIRQGSKTRPSYTAFVAKALAIALCEFPYANRRLFWSPLWPFCRLVQAFQGVDIGVACEKGDATRPTETFLDVMRGAETRTLGDMTVWLRALAQSGPATNGQWRTFLRLVYHFPSPLTFFLASVLPTWVPSLWARYRGGAAFISSPAKYGIDRVTATWSAPVCVSFGLVRERPIARDGRVIAAPTFDLVMSFDRRIMAGAQAARFFARMVQLLERADVEMSPWVDPEVPPDLRDLLPSRSA